jgi:transposase-like protein
VQLLVSDDHAGLGAARAAVFPALLWQRCQFHLQQNAQAYVPRLDQRAAVAQAIRTVFNSPDRPSADRRLKEVVATYADSAPKLAAWMEENLPQGFAILALAPAQQRRLRTTNALERVNMELKPTKTTHARGWTLSQRSFAPALGYRLAGGIQRRMGNWKNLPHMEPLT